MIFETDTETLKGYQHPISRIVMDSVINRHLIGGYIRNTDDVSFFRNSARMNLHGKSFFENKIFLESFLFYIEFYHSALTKVIRVNSALEDGLLTLSIFTNHEKYTDTNFLSLYQTTIQTLVDNNGVFPSDVFHELPSVSSVDPTYRQEYAELVLYLDMKRNYNDRSIHMFEVNSKNK